MIRYPLDTTSIENEDLTYNAFVGKKYIINNRVLTCVDIDNDKYIFSFDEILTLSTHDNLESVLRELYTTGKFDGTEFIPFAILNQIDFLFIPTEYQIFGKREYSESNEKNVKQFEYYKDNTAIKFFKGKVRWYWLSDKSINSTSFCLVRGSGDAYDSGASLLGGVPIFFQIKKRV